MDAATLFSEMLWITQAANTAKVPAQTQPQSSRCLAVFAWKLLPFSSLLVPAGGVFKEL